MSAQNSLIQKTRIFIIIIRQKNWTFYPVWCVIVENHQFYILNDSWGPDVKKTSMSKLFVTFLTKIDNVLHDALVVTVRIDDALGIVIPAK